MAVRAERHQVLEGIISVLAPLDLMVDRRGSLCYETPCTGRTPLSVFRNRFRVLSLAETFTVRMTARPKSSWVVHGVLLRCPVANTRLQAERCAIGRRASGCR
jgi:hypothetical protein